MDSEEKDIPNGKIDELIAWISVASPFGRENFNLTPVAVRVRMPEREIKNILRDNTTSLLHALGQLNDKQRNWVISQANERDGTLLHVSRWTTTPMETVFGNINMTSLFWVTKSASRVVRPMSLGVPVLLADIEESPQFGDGGPKVGHSPAYSAPQQAPEQKPTQEQESITEEQTRQLKIALEKLQSRAGDQKKKKPGTNRMAIPTTYSQTEAVMNEDGDEEEEENLVEKLVSKWINVYDEPSEPD